MRGSSAAAIFNDTRIISHKSQVTGRRQLVQGRSTHPDENQSPSGVGVTSLLMASTMDTAVDAGRAAPLLDESPTPLHIQHKPRGVTVSNYEMPQTAHSTRGPQFSQFHALTCYSRFCQR